MKNRFLKSIFVALSLAGAATLAHAQSYSIDRHTIDGGGGTSSGGQFVVSGTIGQPDAGHMTGGNFSVDGGFWAIYAVQTVGAPTLRIQVTSPNTIVVAWPTAPSTGFVLQQNSDLTTTNWVNVANTVNTVDIENQVIITPSAGNNFFRLIRP